MTSRSLILWFAGPGLVMKTGIHAYVSSGRCLQFPILFAISRPLRPTSPTTGNTLSETDPYP